MERRLDGFERRYWLMGLLRPYTFSSFAEVRGTLEPGHVEAGIAAAHRRHPMLRARVEVRADGPWLVTDAPPPRLEVRPRRGPGAGLAYAEEADAMAYPEAGPLWRAALLQGADRCDLVLSVHHLLCDGLGSYVAVRDVLAYAEQAGRGLAPGPPTLPLPEGMCALLPPEARGPAGQEAFQALVRKLEPLKDAPPRRLVPEREAPPLQRRTVAAYRRLDGPATAALAARAKVERTSVTGALAAAHLLALAGEMGLTAPATLGLNIPANLRGTLAKPTPDGVDWYAFGLPLFFRVGPATAFWDLAREVRRTLDDPALPLTRFAVLAFIDGATPRTPDAAAAELQAAEGFGLTAGSVSSLGRLAPLPDVGDAVVEDFHITGNQTIGGPTVLQVPSTYRGRLALDISHPEPLVSRSRGARIADAVEQHLRAAAR